MRKLARYVSLLLPVQLAAACSQTESPPPQNETAAVPAQTPAQLPPAAPAPQQDERLVLAFGDSLYAGYGLDPGQSFPAVLERELEAKGIRARVVNAGVSGDTAASGLRRLEFTLDGLPRMPDLAIVGLGGNDMLRGLDPAETRRNLDAILAELDKRGIPVLLTGMLAPRNLDGAYIRSFEAIFPDLARRYGAELDPFFLEGVITRPELMLPDGIHPSAAGVEVITRRVAPMVAKELRETAA